MDRTELEKAATSDPPDDVWPTLRRVLSFLGSPDPRLRDELAFAILSDWVYERDLLAPDELREMLAFALSEDGIRHGLGESGTDSVFARSFAVLVVALVLAVDNRSPYLSDVEFANVLTALLEYAGSERDLRGFVPGKGWAHSAAHVADALDECVRSRCCGSSDGLPRDHRAWNRRRAEFIRWPSRGVLSDSSCGEVLQRRERIQAVVSGQPEPSLATRSALRSGGPSQRGPLGGGMPRSAQILRASRKSISRWRGAAVERSASKPQKLWLPPSRKSSAPWVRRWRSRSRRFTRR